MEAPFEQFSSQISELELVATSLAWTSRQVEEPSPSHTGAFLSGCEQIKAEWRSKGGQSLPWWFGGTCVKLSSAATVSTLMKLLSLM